MIKTSEHSASPPPKGLPRLAIVVSHPIQHFCPMYRDIAATGKFDLQVIFTKSGGQPKFDPGFGKVIKWQDDLLEGYEYVVLETTDQNRPDKVAEQLDKFKPDVVYVHGYIADWMRRAIKWGKSHGSPVLICVDSELLHHRPLHTRFVKKIWLSAVLRDVSLFLTVGDENERYYSHYGVPKGKFHRTPFSIDSAYYDRVLTDPAQIRADLRKEWGIGDETTAFITVGKLIPRKAQGDLIRAFAKAMEQKQGRDAVLLIAGDGPDRPMLEELAKPLGNSIRMLGFVGVEDLPRYYTASDVYVHPSSVDPHPLSISEAAYCGLPIIVSDKIGSIGPTDDVQVGKNGWVYPLGDISALADILGKLTDDPEMRKRAGQLSRPLGKVHASDYVAERFVEGALKALGRA